MDAPKINTHPQVNPSSSSEKSSSADEGEVAIILNGQRTQIHRNASLLDLFHLHKLSPQNCAVELDQTIIPRSDYPHTRLHPGSVLEIVRFVGGG